MDKLIQDYVKHQSRGYYSRFWAGTAMGNGITIKYDGKEFLAKLEDIWMEDLGTTCGKCLCGHPIRYQYHIGNVSPIGSTCIQTMTGLKDQDLRLIIKGGDLAKRDKASLIQTIQFYKTLDEQLKQDYILNQQYQFLHENDYICELVQQFVESNCPFPASIKNVIYNEYKDKTKDFKVKDKYGPEIYLMTQNYQQFHEIYSHGKEIPLFVSTIEDIAKKIIDIKATEKSVEYFRTLYLRARNPRLMDAYSVLVKLSDKDCGEFWGNIIADMLGNADKYGMTEAQITMVLDKTSSGKPGIAIRFAGKLVEDVDDVVTLDPKDYVTTNAGDQAINEDGSCDPLLDDINQGNEF